MYLYKKKRSNIFFIKVLPLDRERLKRWTQEATKKSKSMLDLPSSFVLAIEIGTNRPYLLFRMLCFNQEQTIFSILYHKYL